MSEQRMTREEFRQPARQDDLQHYLDYHGRLSPSQQDEFSAHPSRLLRDRPTSPPASLLQGPDGSMRRQQWEFSLDSQSQQHQRILQQRPKLHHQHQQQQQMQEQHHRARSSNSVQNDRGSSHWLTQISPSPIMDPTVVKPKRKYTKKSSLLPQARTETHDQVNVQTRQESNKLLYSDRGLILKTQIPKKGRPISKHSTTSSQSTPTLTSLGILPASHLYFSKAEPPSSLSSSAMSGLVAAATGRYLSESTLNTHNSSPQGQHSPLMTDQRSPVISATSHRPGRPLSNSSLSRHAHSQSYSGGPSISFPPPHSGQAQPLPSPTAHEFDLHSTRYKDRQNLQELDDNRFSAYQDRSPTLPVATTASSQQPLFRHRQLPEYRFPTSHRRYVSSPIDQEFSGEELEYRNEKGDPRYPEGQRMTVDTPSTLPPPSFAEGVPAQMNTLKRSISGMQKSLSMDGYHSRPIEDRRRSVGGNIVGGGKRGTMGYEPGGKFEDVNEEAGSNFFDEEFDDSAVDTRSRKRISGSDLDYSGVDGIGVGRVGNDGGGGGVRRRINRQGGNKTWHGATSGLERRRPRSLVLPRGRGEPALPWMNMLDSGSQSGSKSGSGSGSMVGVLPGQRHLDIDDDEIDYREMMIMTPATAPSPPSPPPPPPALSSSSNSLMVRGGTVGKGRGGRSMHSHARSLDITTFSAPSHREHRPLSPSSLDRPSRHDMHSTEELLPEQQRALMSGHRLYASSSSSLNSRPFGDTPSISELISLISNQFFATNLIQDIVTYLTIFIFSSIGNDQEIFNTDIRGTHSSDDHRRYNHLDTARPPPIITRADILAREMMSETHSTSSGGGGGRGRGRRGSSHGHHHLKAAVVKRSTSKRGPGPHLKKHQILQQQLYQIQRDQEKMDLQMTLQLQKRQMQQQQQLNQEQEQERQDLEQQRQLKQQKQPQQQRKAPHPQRHQHSQSLQLQHEFSSLEFNQKQQQQGQQQQPRPGRPTKQRVLLRSESALAVLHGMHSPPLGSTLSQSQSQPSLPQSATSTTSSASSTSKPQPSSRRRQNQQQPILLRPVSLPSLTGSSGNSGGGGSGVGGGAGGMDSGSSPPYSMNHPPPGQPLFRSIHAPYLVSPSSLVSVASNASSSTGTTGTEATLASLGRGRGGGGERDEEDEDGDGDRSRRPSSPVKSPHISYSTTPPLTTGSRMFTPPYSHRDSQGYPPYPQPYQPHHHHQQQQQSNHHGHHHHPYQRPAHHSVSTSSISSITSPHQDTLSTTSSITTLSKRSSHPPGAMSMSRSSSRGGMSTTSSTTTLVHSSAPQSSLHQHQQQHHQHRHSSSLPSLNYYYQSSTASSSSTSPQHPLDKKYQQNQQQRMLNNPPPDQQNYPTRPPIHRMVSHDTQPPALPPHKHTFDSTTAFHSPDSGPGPQSSTPTTTTTTTTTTTNAVGEEESVERLLIRTPLGDV
ncbi:hypothetical protein F5H01DRAFT_404977 [Linnemannia elongata]|nr:hypothetical protein F5H01DRAFT_404977 [Linnemannia elongata]